LSKLPCYIQHWGKQFNSWILADEGVTSVEYAMVGVLIAVVIVGAVTSVGLELGDAFDYIANCVKNLSCA
jgi:Flp pilus assembly pilin Flp